MKKNISFAGSWKSARFALAFALLFAVGSFGFYACSNKNVASEEVKPEKIGKTNKNTLVNPYNYVGVFHNDALTHFSTQPNFHNLTQTQMVDLTASLYTTQNQPNANLLTSQFLQNFYIANPTHNLKTLADSLYAISAISQNVKTAWTTLSNHFTDPALKNFSNYKTAFAHLKNNIAQTEQALLQNTYNDLDKAYIFTVVATAKHSTIFWEGVLYDSNNPYYQLEGRIRWWEWILIGLADAGGGAFGMVRGLSLGGPMGVVHGVVGSVMCGAAASSAAYDYYN